MSSYTTPPSGWLMMPGTAELSMVWPLKMTFRPATLACCTMVKLPVFAGTEKGSFSPTRCGPKAMTCGAGSALATMGREHAGGTQSDIGKHTAPCAEQHV